MAESSDIVKNAANSTEIMGRKIKALDAVAAKCKKRHTDALENLERMRHSLAEKQKNLEFMQKSRDELHEKIEADKQKAKDLRQNLRRTEKQFKDVVESLHDGARVAIHGRGDVKGLRRTKSQAISRELVALRGYSTASGTAPAHDPLEQTSNPLGTMRRAK
mmetsp:Transcript_78944/g.223414  ORF Transcript_78944/g.223414 Transcript_78944/m.223414 type:complete len:162 (+) Transcript_78944:197-682(+)